ncbi:hypothetical protein ACJMK2_039434 [Sinanodonta woodiana]|uniref:Uncharacterized protein n=1 Tax=Sinanodonta woodiana TaxID=1069815 RepID=A0ABD3WBX8_SINWO
MTSTRVIEETIIIISASKIVLKQNISNEEHLKMQSKCKEGKGSEGTEQEFATVEYNHPKFYLGIILDENTLYFVKNQQQKCREIYI